MGEGTRTTKAGPPSPTTMGALTEKDFYPLPPYTSLSISHPLRHHHPWQDHSLLASPCSTQFPASAIISYTLQATPLRDFQVFPTTHRLPASPASLPPPSTTLPSSAAQAYIPHFHLPHPTNRRHPTTIPTAQNTSPPYYLPPKLPFLPHLFAGCLPTIFTAIY